jgi:hypothetical protein
MGMLPQKPLSRRQFITSVSSLALAAVMASKLELPSAEIVIVNGWILKRNELA